MKLMRNLRERFSRQEYIKSSTNTARTLSSSSLTSQMETLPTELHSSILSLACDMDERSAFNLLLASKYIHSVALPFRFYHVRVSEPSRFALAFCALEQQPAPTRVIRHLTIGDGSTNSHTQRRSGRGVYSSIGRLLELASPTLDSLDVSLYHISTVDQLHVISMSFPRLRQLTLFCRRLNGRAIKLPTMPQLESLHVIGDSLLIEEIPPIAPHLRTLHLQRYPIPKWFLEHLETIRDSTAGLPRKNPIPIPGGFIPHSAPSNDDLRRVDLMIACLDRFTVELGRPWCMEARYARLDVERRSFLDATRDALTSLATRLPVLVFREEALEERSTCGS
ncbi:hypothetical protein PUNSTDRAFT_146500 [Punctularia strigosozonata HHB-11173 SS5]|uniref:Uncharacterized protein n=1 Tax=Punctularia strigosozonata (strain HHB-11173) TaxID=741275 RepID=R7S3Y7_PUNST|nr:uncharacterized protein PUNSTDRAFT_146500 [Punctularia strigosozonata HHB-11173 SS5]EIN04569.1 hypothetical protein PUNSTDRAFT_146500 [Punctularia strigosozonata HHB-11173 SS5]